MVVERGGSTTFRMGLTIERKSTTISFHHEKPMRHRRTRGTDDGCRGGGSRGGGRRRRRRRRRRRMRKTSGVEGQPRWVRERKRSTTVPRGIGEECESECREFLHERRPRHGGGGRRHGVSVDGTRVVCAFPLIPTRETKTLVPFGFLLFHLQQDLRMREVHVLIRIMKERIPFAIAFHTARSGNTTGTTLPCVEGRQRRRKSEVQMSFGKRTSPWGPWVSRRFSLSHPSGRKEKKRRRRGIPRPLPRHRRKRGGGVPL